MCLKNKTLAFWWHGSKRFEVISNFRFYNTVEVRGDGVSGACEVTGVT